VTEPSVGREGKGRRTEECGRERSGCVVMGREGKGRESIQLIMAYLLKRFREEFEGKVI